MKDWTDTQGGFKSRRSGFFVSWHPGFVGLSDEVLNDKLNALIAEGDKSLSPLYVYNMHNEREEDTKPNMTPEELRSSLRGIFFRASGGITDMANVEIDEAIQLFADLCGEVIAPDVLIYSEGKLVKHGDPVMIDFNGGVDSERFRESCRNIQENGRNLEKADARKRVTKLTGKEI